MCKGAEKGSSGEFNELQMFSMESVFMKLMGDEPGDMESYLGFILSDLSFI